MPGIRLRYSQRNSANDLQSFKSGYDLQVLPLLEEVDESGFGESHIGKFVPFGGVKERDMAES